MYNISKWISSSKITPGSVSVIYTRIFTRLLDVLVVLSTTSTRRLPCESCARELGFTNGKANILSVKIVFSQAVSS